MSNKLRTKVTVSIALTAMLALAGCSSDSGEASPSEGKPTTDWRTSGEQTPVNPDDVGFVDQTATSRQDGAKDIKFVSLRVPKVDVITGRTIRSDEITVMRVTASEVTSLGSFTAGSVYGLRLDSSGKLRLQEFSVEGGDQYSITLTVEYVSGYEAPVNESSAPLFWPVTESGVTTYLTSGTTGFTLNESGLTTINLTAITKVGAPAPTGVRYMQFDARVEKVLSPIIDVFPQGAAVVTPRDEKPTDQ